MIRGLYIDNGGGFVHMVCLPWYFTFLSTSKQSLRKRSRSYDLWVAKQIVAFNRLGIELWVFFSLYHQDRLRLTRFYKEKFHWTTNKHWITHIYFREVIGTWPLTEFSQILTAESNGAKDWTDFNEIEIHA